MKRKGVLSDEDFKRLGEENTIDLKEEKEKVQEGLKDCYHTILDLYKKYGDMNEIYPPILTCWAIGTYFHREFNSYPFLFFNAMKSSGKSRILKLTMDLSLNGQVNNNMTEAVLFRTTGALGIDEFEGLSRRGAENLRELLNSAYKKGVKVRRMKQQKTPEGVEQVVEEFDVYRPLALANIYGMEDVLGDRTIPIILERSNKISVVNLIEIWEQETEFVKITTLLRNLNLKGNGVVSCSLLSPGTLYRDWNKWVLSNNTTTHTNNNTKQQYFFNKITKSEFNGRELEITFPILIVAQMIGDDILDGVIKSLSLIIKGKREDQFIESRDVSLIDFVSQSPHIDKYLSVSIMAREFKDFLQEDESEEKWINAKWVGRALKRLSLVKESRRLGRGREVVLDIEKAQEKIKMFK